MTQGQEIPQKLERIKLLEEKSRLREGLPFLYGWKWYTWAREFFESINKINILVAANQISKSSTQIRKCIDWATDKQKWPLLWRMKPTQFWYLYPTKDVATVEFEKKWIPEFLPSGEFKDDPVYGWKAEYDKRKIYAIHFNSGVSVYFKTYEQDTSHLQSGTVHAVFTDEELPVEIWDELQLRVAATDGYIHLVFTATLGQEHWRQCIELKGTSEEVLPEAAKWQVSMYDCMHYDDGTPSPWTEEKINRIKMRCKSEAEILKRVYGRFVLEDGKKYPAYVSEKNRGPRLPIPDTWLIFSAVDIGSGGATGHPAGIIFIAVRPDYQYARVFKAWRGDGIPTTASDILMKYLDLRGSMKVVRQFYDQGSRDFYTIASRIGEHFEASAKSHESGEQVVNALFKNQMLSIDQGDTDLDKLDIELNMLLSKTDKRKAKDDLIDPTRYICNSIPWDWSAMDLNVFGEAAPKLGHFGGLDELRRSGKLPESEDPAYLNRDEFEEQNEYY